MTLALKQIKVYLKLIAICAVVVVVLLVVLMNRKNTVDVWFFRGYEDINVLWLMLITAVAAIIGWWSISRLFGTVRELKNVRQSVYTQKQLDEQRRLAREMADREKRIDEKIHRSLTEEPDSPGSGVNS